MTAGALRDLGRISFVCTGNICRSPMADVILRHCERLAGRSAGLEISSGGLGSWHIGEQADPRARAALRRHGYDGDDHRARHFTAASFAETDLVLGFDAGHLDGLARIAPSAADRAKIQLLLPYAWSDDPSRTPTDPEIHDPYYSDERAFDETIRLVDAAVRHLHTRLAAARNGR